MKQIPTTILAAGLLFCASVALGGEAPGEAATGAADAAEAPPAGSPAGARRESALPGEDPGARHPALEPPHPAARPRIPDEIDVRLMQGADLTLPELLRASGRTSYVILALSLALVAAALYCAIECRGGRILPRAVHAEVMAHLGARERAGALSRVEGGGSLYARGAARAFAEPVGVPPDELRALVKASGERDAAILRKRLAIVPQLGAVAALVGLVGTLVGMIQAFGLAARGVYEPVLAYAAVFKALVTSLFSIGLAVVALALYFLLSAGLERALAEAGLAFEEVIAALRRTSCGKDRDGEAEAAARDASSDRGERGPG